MKKIKLNIGCGETKLKGFINIDLEKSTKPDLLHDITKGQLPFKENSVDEIYWHHNIEHIQYKLWVPIINDFLRVLKPNGLLFMSYPEFDKCAKFFMENYKGQKDFWRATLYGRQLYPGDYHIAPVQTADLVRIFKRLGFAKIQWCDSPESEHETTLGCRKAVIQDHETLLKQELFKGHKVVKGKYK